MCAKLEKEGRNTREGERRDKGKEGSVREKKRGK